ncbi:hypothetical protein [Spirillospora sp. NPDC047279]|uniref:hypothetical protein n=1 Tax=Spirillospora sp. NPDC047279 TaxID=3155478 RepID=UPI0033E1FC60
MVEEQPGAVREERQGVVRKAAQWTGVIAWILGLFAFIGGGAGVIPGIIAFTLLFGEPATATVTECAGGGKGRSLDCSGTWRTGGGDGGEGHISGVSRADLDRRVDVRLGPLGPYAKPLHGYWQIYTVVPVAGWLAYLGVRRKVRGSRAGDTS